MSGIKDAKRRQQRRRRKKKIQRLTVLFGSLFLILLLVFTIRGITQKSNEKEKKEEKKTTVKKEKIDTSHVEVKNLVINTKDNKKGKTKLAQSPSVLWVTVHSEQTRISINRVA